MNKPNLRFKGFTDDWETVNIKDVCKIISGGTPNTKRSEYWDGDIPWISIADFSSVKKEITHTEKTITTMGLENSSTKILHKGDIILSARGTIGALAQITKDMAFNQSCYGLRSNNNVIPEYLFYTVKNSIYILKENSYGAVFNTITKKTFDTLFLSIPTMQEQAKIANFFILIDKQITILENQKTRLEDYKKTLATKLFTQSKRFEGFTEKWQTVRLGDICQYANGKSFEKNIIINGCYSLITLNSIDIKGNLKLFHKTINETDNSLIKNDLVMVLSDIAHGNFLGLSDLIPCNNKYVLNQRMGRLRLNNNVNPLYIRKYINTNQNYFKLHGQGSSQLNLSKGDILKFNINLPTIEEQEKIAHILSNIDHLITQKQTHLTQTLKYKTYLLQNMLI